MVNSTEVAEKKWQREINATFSIKFWDDCWNLLKNPHIDNKVKWLQFQIIRHILPNNYSVNKYNFNQTPDCSFCPPPSHLEQLQFLLWDCPKVNHFWLEVEVFLNIFYPSFFLSKRKAIFGDKEADIVVNTILLWSKRFLWVQKFTTKKLNIVAYIKFLKNNLRELMLIWQLKNKFYDFMRLWGKLLEYFEIEKIPAFTIH